MSNTIIEEFVAKLGLDVDKKAIVSFQDQLKKSFGFFAKLGTIVAGFAGVTGAVFVQTNLKIRETDIAAKALGTTFEKLSTLHDTFKLGDIGSEDVNKLLLNLNRNINDSNKADAFRKLRLNMQEIRKLPIDEQFKRILEGARKVDSQVARGSLAEIIDPRGQISSKVLGYLESQNISVGELIEKYRKFNFANQDSVNGALRFSQAFREAISIIGTLREQVSGLVGGAIAPLIESFVQWSIANKELIQSKIKIWAESLVKLFKWLFSTFRTGYSILEKIVDRLGGLENTLKIIGVVIASWQIASVLKPFSNFVGLLSDTAKVDGWGNAIKSLAGNLGKDGVLGLSIATALIGFDELYHWFKGDKTVIAAWGAEQGAALADIERNLLIYFGIFKNDKEVDLWRVGQERAFDKFLEYLSKVPSMVATDMSKIWAWLKYGFTSPLEAIKNDWFNFVDWIKQQIESVRLDLAKIPIIGGFFSHGKNVANPVVSPGINTGGINPVHSGINLSSIAANEAQKNLTSKNTTKNFNVENRVTIQQQPGESGEDLSKRVTKHIEESFRRVGYAFDSGVEY